jgi:hypothetical protein
VDAAAGEMVTVPAGDAGLSRSCQGALQDSMTVVGPALYALSGRPPFRLPVPDSMHTAGSGQSAPN